MHEKFISLTPEIYRYVVDHNPPLDAVLRDLQRPRAHDDAVAERARGRGVGRDSHRAGQEPESLPPGRRLGRWHVHPRWPDGTDGQRRHMEQHQSCCCNR